jgi:hypothetical protein
MPPPKRHGECSGTPHAGSREAAAPTNGNSVVKRRQIAVQLAKHLCLRSQMLNLENAFEDARSRTELVGHLFADPKGFRRADLVIRATIA